MKEPSPQWRAQWQAKIDAAQAETHLILDGERLPRKPYGKEHGAGFAYKPLCRDCGVKLGQLHVYPCCVERCPRCDGQLNMGGCGCEVAEVQ